MSLTRRIGWATEGEHQKTVSNRCDAHLSRVIWATLRTFQRIKCIARSSKGTAKRMVHRNVRFNSSFLSYAVVSLSTLDIVTVGLPLSIPLVSPGGIHAEL